MDQTSTLFETRQHIIHRNNCEICSKFKKKISHLLVNFQNLTSVIELIYNINQKSLKRECDFPFLIDHLMFCVLIFSNIWKCTDLISICILQMDESNNCHICSSNQKCVQLSSNTSYCVEGMYSVIRLCFQILFYIKIYLATCIHY